MRWVTQGKAAAASIQTAGPQSRGEAGGVAGPDAVLAPGSGHRPAGQDPARLSAQLPRAQAP